MWAVGAGCWGPGNKGGGASRTRNPSGRRVGRWGGVTVRQRSYSQRKRCCALAVWAGSSVRRLPRRQVEYTHTYAATYATLPSSLAIRHYISHHYYHYRHCFEVEGAYGQEYHRLYHACSYSQPFIELAKYSIPRIDTPTYIEYTYHHTSRRQQKMPSAAASHRYKWGNACVHPNNRSANVRLGAAAPPSTRGGWGHKVGWWQPGCGSAVAVWWGMPCYARLPERFHMGTGW